MLELDKAQAVLYQPIGLKIEGLSKEPESQDYLASTFRLNKKLVRFRVAKTTPTKTGQFVTIWKRIGKGPIMPFDIADDVDLFIINVKSGERLGQFIFPKEVLCAKDIVSKNSKGGKRAMRVYAPWANADNAQAKKTQAWQKEYFFEVVVGKFDTNKLKSLLNYP